MVEVVQCFWFLLICRIYYGITTLLLLTLNSLSEIWSFTRSQTLFYVHCIILYINLQRLRSFDLIKITWPRSVRKCHTVKCVYINGSNLFRISFYTKLIQLQDTLIDSVVHRASLNRCILFIFASCDFCSLAHWIFCTFAFCIYFASLH